MVCNQPLVLQAILCPAIQPLLLYDKYLTEGLRSEYVRLYVGLPPLPQDSAGSRVHVPTIQEGMEDPEMDTLELEQGALVGAAVGAAVGAVVGMAVGAGVGAQTTEAVLSVTQGPPKPS